MYEAYYEVILTAILGILVGRWTFKRTDNPKTQKRHRALLLILTFCLVVLVSWASGALYWLPESQYSAYRWTTQLFVFSAAHTAYWVYGILKALWEEVFG